jgi:hypothetical protein
MPESRFSALITVEDWAGELGTILGEVDEAVQSGEIRERLGAQELLSDYIKASPSAAEALDKIAARASLDLLQAQVDDVIAAIAARNSELKAATTLIRQSAAEAKSSKKALQFEKVLDTLKTARAGIEAFKKLGDAAADEDAELTERLTAIAKAIADFEKLVAKLSGESGSRTRGTRSRSAKPATRSPAERAPRTRAPKTRAPKKAKPKKAKPKKAKPKKTKPKSG